MHLGGAALLLCLAAAGAQANTEIRTVGPLLCDLRNNAPGFDSKFLSKSW